jgi:hypothetical protein
MENNLIQKKFNDIGAALSFEHNRTTRFGSNPSFSIDVIENMKGEHFVLVNPEEFPVEVLDVQAQLRHLLLLVRRQSDKGAKDLRRFLCGHDERHWFVAAVPESERVSTVKQAVEALKPEPVKNEQERIGIKTKDLNKRKTAGYVRQGEWFFIPRPDVTVQEYLIHENEPLRRGRGKPHTAQFLYRSGGETVYVCRQYPNGLTENEYGELIRNTPGAKKFAWRTMTRNAMVLVKGRISHPDHATIVLDIWHQVVPNTESKAAAFQDLAFLD